MRYPALVLVILGSLSSSLSALSESDSDHPKTQGKIRKAAAFYAPRPPYPAEARRRGLVGSGLAILEVDKRTGYVKSARMQTSTGHKILDDAALTAFRQWRFKPGVVLKAKIPIRYSTRGFSF